MREVLHARKRNPLYDLHKIFTDVINYANFDVIG